MQGVISNDKAHIALTNTTLGNAHTVSESDDAVTSVPRHAPQVSRPVDPTVDKWFFISGANL